MVPRSCVQELALLLGINRFNAARAKDFESGKGACLRIDAAGGGVEFGSNHEQPQSKLNCLRQAHIRRPWAAIVFLEADDAANRSRTGARSGIANRLELRAQRIIEVNLRLG